jgi:hypothetical protein
MARRHRKFNRGTGRHPITLAVQDLHIRHRFPRFHRIGRGGHAKWKGTLQPRESSPEYHVSVHYEVGHIPKVFVDAPPITATAPHRYSDGSLCLYWPVEWTWSQDKLIADTILPWAALWLYYYELWLDCGEWRAPSSHQPTEGKGTS